MSTTDKIKTAFIVTLVILPGTIFILPAVILFAKQKGIDLVPSTFKDKDESSRTNRP